MELDYSEIYRTYHPRVCRYLARLTGESEAEDLAQKVFLRVYEGLARLEDEKKIGSWIFKIALNAARDRIRQRKGPKEAARGLPIPGSEVRADPADRLTDNRPRSPVDRLVRREMLECYLDFVEKLPEAYYAVYTMSEFEGLSDREIAERLSLPLETVKMRLHRARQRLFGSLRANCVCYHNERGDLLAAPRENMVKLL